MGSTNVRGMSDQVTSAGTPARKNTCSMLTSYFALLDFNVHPFIVVACVMNSHFDDRTSELVRHFIDPTSDNWSIVIPADVKVGIQRQITVFITD